MNNAITDLFHELHHEEFRVVFIAGLYTINLVGIPRETDFVTGVDLNNERQGNRDNSIRTITEMQAIQLYANACNIVAAGRKVNK